MIQSAILSSLPSFPGRGAPRQSAGADFALPAEDVGTEGGATLLPDGDTRQPGAETGNALPADPTAIDPWIMVATLAPVVPVSTRPASERGIAPAPGVPVAAPPTADVPAGTASPRLSSVDDSAPPIETTSPALPLGDAAVRVADAVMPTNGPMLAPPPCSTPVSPEAPATPDARLAASARSRVGSGGGPTISSPPRPASRSAADPAPADGDPTSLLDRARVTDTSTTVEPPPMTVASMSVDPPVSPSIAATEELASRPVAPRPPTITGLRAAMPALAMAKAATELKAGVTGTDGTMISDERAITSPNGAMQAAPSPPPANAEVTAVASLLDHPGANDAPRIGSAAAPARIAVASSQADPVEMVRTPLPADGPGAAAAFSDRAAPRTDGLTTAASIRFAATPTGLVAEPAQIDAPVARSANDRPAIATAAPLDALAAVTLAGAAVPPSGAAWTQSLPRQATPVPVAAIDLARSVPAAASVAGLPIAAAGVLALRPATFGNLPAAWRVTASAVGPAAAPTAADAGQPAAFATTSPVDAAPTMPPAQPAMGTESPGEPASASSSGEPTPASGPEFRATALTTQPTVTPLRDQPPLAPLSVPSAVAFGAARFAAQVAERTDDRLPIVDAAGPATLVAAAPAIAPAPVASAPLDVRHERWPTAMIERIEMIRDAAADAADAADTRIRLVPDALGAIDVAVERDGDTLHVRFNAEQPQTRALLQDAQPRLAEAAEARGLRLGQTSVGADPSGQQQPQRQPHQPAATAPRAPLASVAAAIEADADDLRLA